MTPRSPANDNRPIDREQWLFERSLARELAGDSELDDPADRHTGPPR